MSATKKKVVKKKGGGSKTTGLQNAMNSGAFGLVGMLPGLFGMNDGNDKPSKKVTIKKTTN